MSKPYGRPGCPYCHGEGVVYERHPYGSTTAEETLNCDCAGVLNEAEEALVVAELKRRLTSWTEDSEVTPLMWLQESLHPDDQWRAVFEQFEIEIEPEDIDWDRLIPTALKRAKRRSQGRRHRQSAGLKSSSGGDTWQS